MTILRGVTEPRAIVRGAIVRGGGAAPPAPTYATWNPLDRYTPDADPTLGVPTLSTDLLTASYGGGWFAVRATVGKPTGHWYAETIVDTAGIGFLFGIASLASPLTYQGDGGAIGWGIGHSGGTGYTMSPGSATPNAFPIITGDRIGIELNWDANQLICTRIRSGPTVVTVATLDISSAVGISMFPMLSLFDAAGTTDFGSTTFFAPLPSGASGFTV